MTWRDEFENDTDDEPSERASVVERSDGFAYACCGQNPASFAPCEDDEIERCLRVIAGANYVEVKAAVKRHESETGHTMREVTMK